MARFVRETGQDQQHRFAQRFSNRIFGDMSHGDILSGQLDLIQSFGRLVKFFESSG